jgi:hypothetical protein
LIEQLRIQRSVAGIGFGSAAAEEAEGPEEVRCKALIEKVGRWG